MGGDQLVDFDDSLIQLLNCPSFGVTEWIPRRFADWGEF